MAGIIVATTDLLIRWIGKGATRVASRSPNDPPGGDAEQIQRAKSSLLREPQFRGGPYGDLLAVAEPVMRGWSSRSWHHQNIGMSRRGLLVVSQWVLLPDDGCPPATAASTKLSALALMQ